ncbi:uncharacterized protein LOC129892787 [Solanum dulcamara]|uniref:uncharacterized protein LOC129892787 n=1 Tax=Solanum dulcamara TaxID=45834 RepID=UPI0024862AE2|nr:uncharacterized protein LOC129892787 [Solanum dulcamara]
MAKTCTRVDFHRLMETIEKVDVKLKEYLKLTGYDKWARCYAKVHRGLSVTSNIAESLNIVLVSTRELLISDFLEQVVSLTEYVQNVIDDGRNLVVCLLKKYVPVEDLYKPKIVLKIYEMPIYFLPNIKEWVIVEYILDNEVLPPNFRRRAGRPRKKIYAKGSKELLETV